MRTNKKLTRFDYRRHWTRLSSKERQTLAELALVSMPMIEADDDFTESYVADLQGQFLHEAANATTQQEFNAAMGKLHKMLDTLRVEPD